MICNIGNFDGFLSQNNSLLDKCSYLYYKRKCTDIIRKIFFAKIVSDEECAFLEKHTGYGYEYWNKLSADFQEDSRFDTTITEEFLDANNMPSAI